MPLPLILPERSGVQSELANWFGKDFAKLNIAFTSNLGTNAAILAMQGLGYPISIEGAGRYWRSDLLVQQKAVSGDHGKYCDRMAQEHSVRAGCPQIH